MPIEFTLPAVGENIEQAEIGNVLVKEGDVISAGQIVAEIETEKAVFELPCPNAGKVTKVHIKQGQSVNVGAPLLSIEEAVPAEAEQPAAKPQAEAAPKPQAALTPKQEAAKPQAKQPEKQAPREATECAPAVAAAALGEENGETAPPAPAGPATRRLARELGVDLHRVHGSGPGGRINAEDVQAYVRQLTSGAVTSAGAIAAPPLPDFSQFGPTEREPLNKILRTAASNLSLAWNVIPHVTQHELADVTDLEAGRKRYAQAHAKDENAPKVTMTALAMKAVVTALKAFPQCNASFDAINHDVILKRYYNIGVAVDTEQGLLVPVIRDVDKKTVLALAAELADLAAKARNRKLAVADFQGGTFTITNLGGIGGTAFTPIVNYPEVAILGMSRASQQQVIIDGKAEIRLMLPLSLSYDHRVINGAAAARFIVKVAALLADPFVLLSEI